MSDEETSFGFSIGFDKKPAGAPARGRAELRVLLCAELLPRAEFRTAERELQALPLEPGDPDAILRELCPAFQIELPDPFGLPQPLTLDLRWDALRALRPHEMVQGSPLLQSFVKAANVLEQGDRAARAELERVLPRAAWVTLVLGAPGAAESRADPERRRTPAAEGRARAPERSSLDALLERVELPGAEAPEAAPQAPREPHAESPPGATAPSAGATPRARLGLAFERLLRSLYRHPEVRRLERAYRSLELVARRLARGAPVRVQVLPLAEDSGADAVRAFVRRLPPDEHPDLIAVDARLRGVEADLARLDAWAELGEELGAPVVVEADPSLFGASSLEVVARTTRAWSSPDDVETLPLRRVAARENSRWLVLAFNGLIGRAPFSPETSRLRELPFDEDDGTDAAWLVLSPAVGVALLAIRSMTQHGHPYALAGAESAIDNLALREISEHGQTAAIPLAARFGADQRRELSRAGLAVFTCRLNADTAFLERAPVLFRGADVVRGARNFASVSVADQLAVGRMARALAGAVRRIPDGAPDGAASDTILAALSELFPNPPPVGPELDLEFGQGGRITLRVRPHRYGGLELEEVELGARRA